MPVAVSSPPTQPRGPTEPFLTAQMAPLIAAWSPLPSPMKSGNPVPGHSSVSVVATCCTEFARRGGGGRGECGWFLQKRLDVFLGSSGS